MFAMGPAFFGRGVAALALSGTFPAATVGAAYDQYLTISGGVTPYSLTGGTGLASGSLPAGLSLSIASTTHLRLSGTPTTSGTAAFTVSVDSTDSQTATSAQSVVTSAGVTYLDSITPLPTAVLSLRKLISTATKSIRVRRSTDNVEQDIGFVGNALDTSSLSTFIGSASGYVTTIYDQIGSNNVVQATASMQPAIISSGTYNGGIKFDGATSNMQIASLAMNAAPYAGLYGKFLQAHASSYKTMFELTADGVANSGGFSWYINNNNASQVGGTGIGKSNVFTMASVTSMTQLTMLVNRTLTGLAEVAMRRAGVAVTASSGGTSDPTGNLTTAPMYFGARAGTSYYSDMLFDTMVIYNSDTSAQVASIESIVS